MVQSQCYTNKEKPDFSRLKASLWQLLSNHLATLLQVALLCVFGALNGMNLKCTYPVLSHKGKALSFNLIRNFAETIWPHFLGWHCRDVW